MTVPFNRVLRVGARGLDVAAVHVGLRRAGHREIRLGRQYTRRVRDAVAAFQRANHLHADGVYGPATHAKLAPHFNRYARRIYRLSRRPKPRYVDVQGAAVPRQLAAVIRPSLAATGATIFSCYRGSDPQGAAILRAHGKHTQEQLYYGWIHRLPGFSPANRPGTSTHELRSDSIAYAGPTGRVLAWWECGMDVDDGHVDAFVRHLASRGVVAHRPYGFGAEYHHVNLRSRPPLRLWIGK